VSRRLAVAVLVSGEGTTLDALAEMALGDHLPARIVLVVADRPHAPAVERARQRGLPTLVLPSRGTDLAAWSERLTEELIRAGAELVVLAGFLTILPPSWVDRWAGRAINVHPALLPRYGGRGMYGAKVHAAVLAAGDRTTGATVHLVTGATDAGPVLAQRTVPVEPGDTPAALRDRLHPVEVALLAETVRRFADGELPLPYRAPEAPATPERDGRDGRR